MGEFRAVPSRYREKHTTRRTPRGHDIQYFATADNHFIILF